MEIAEFIFTTVGIIFTIVASIFALGRVFGKHQSDEKVEAAKIIEMAIELAEFRAKLDVLNDTIHELEKADVLSTQKVETLEGQQKVMFKMIDKLGDKIEVFMNKMFEFKG